MNTDIRKKLQEENEITREDTKELMDYETYGSMGMISTLIDILVMVQERIKRGDVIVDAESGKKLIEADYKKYVESHFTPYVVKEMYKETKLTKDVYFRLDNTAEGVDIIYNANKPSKLFKWIADIDETYALVYLRFNHVVYIQNRKTQDVELMYSEHNNCYVYDETDGKIKEAFK